MLYCTLCRGQSRLLSHCFAIDFFAGEKRTFLNGKTKSEMTGMPIRVQPYGGYSDAVVVEVSGRGYYTGEASYWMEEGDPRGNGFLIR